MKSMKILYVEDDKVDAKAIQRELSKNAPHVHMNTVVSQKEALERLERNMEEYDLVLTDLQLPDGDGLTLLKHIRGQALPLAVVVITGRGDEETAVTVLKAGADDYVVKRDNYVERLPLTLESALHRYHADVIRRAHPLRVLYAEHNPTDIDLTRRHLERYAPYITLEAMHTAPDVIARLTSVETTNTYDVVLLDYRLPGMNALELLKELHERYRLEIPVVLVTGQGDVDVATQALKLGAIDYIAKNAGYLYQLPSVLQNAYHRAQLGHEQAALKKYAEQLEEMVQERTRELQETQEQLVRQEKLAILGQLAGGVGHELRTPLATISNAVYYLNLTLPDAEHNTREYLGIIDAEIRNSERIITELLDFARIETPNPQAVHLDVAIRQSLLQQALPPEIHLELDIPTALLPVCVDPRHIEHILQHLLLNAYQAMPEGGELRITARADDKMLELTMADSGHGIPPEHLPKLFEPLFSTKSRGIGLGLAICKKLLEANNGSIAVESQKGQGSAFLMTLPLKREPL